MSFGLYGSGMPGFILDEIELGTRVAMYLDDENVAGMRLPLLSYEVEHWNCPADDEEHERVHDVRRAV